MTLNEARNQRAEFLADALGLYKRVKQQGGVRIDRNGNLLWGSKNDELNWKMLHAAADGAVARYYAEQRRRR
ncbi:MAG TPA: hypothetical protein VD906_07030 [Caulobacteraceae bacterium]|nr:hypothetical protein [Caulobacteraceae bacterium]